MQKIRTTTGTAVVTRAIEMEFVGGDGEAVAIDTEFQFRAADPYAVTVVFKSAGAPVVWTFARDLLVEGRFEPAGNGDVQVWPCLSHTGTAVVVLELVSPSGEVLVQAPTREVNGFVADMLTAVPQGSELDAVSIDDELYALLAS